MQNRSHSSRLPTPELLEVFEKAPWINSPLGHPDTWPAELSAAVSVLFAQPTAGIIRWGKELIQIYNDAYAAIARNRHPRGMGQATFDCWPEIEKTMQPYFDRVLSGESIHLEDFSLAFGDLPTNTDRFFFSLYESDS